MPLPARLRQSPEPAAPPGLRRSAADLHSWLGLVPGWLMFLIFLFGTTAFFQDEISAWMRPELGSGAVQPVALARAQAWLAATAPHAESWTIKLPPTRGGEPLTAAWQDGSAARAPLAKQDFDPRSGRPVAVRETQGGFFLYRFHRELYFVPRPLGALLVCIVSLAMLVTIVSGIITHKKMFSGFFTLRFGRGARSWLDAHNVGGVLALPFHLMITYTGLVSLLFTLMPWAISANFPNNAAFFAHLYPPPAGIAPSGQAAPVLPIATLIERAEHAVPGIEPLVVTIRRPGDAGAIAEIVPQDAALGAMTPRLLLSAVTGARLAGADRTGAAGRTQQVMVQLHAARFAGLSLRWLYFLSGLVGTGMIAGGLILWTAKRRGRAQPHRGLWLAERLNIAVLAGAPLGIGVYFLANRLLPVGAANRAAWEINSLFIAWGALVVWAVARPVRRAAIEAAAACAIVYAAVPVVNALTTTRGLAASLAAGDWQFAGFDGVMLASAAAFGLAAAKLAASKPRVRAAPSSARRAEAAR